jgi:hypothetical protein
MFDVEWETASAKGPDAGVHEFTPPCGIGCCAVLN